jgi:hypothetical protein
VQNKANLPDLLCRRNPICGPVGKGLGAVVQNKANLQRIE